MDFYDKLITAIVCVIVTFICVFNTFSFADTEVEPSVLSDISVINSKFVESTNSAVVYSLIEGHSYTFYNNVSFSRKIYFSSEFPSYGVPAIEHTVDSNSTYKFTVDSDSYFYVSQVSSSVDYMLLNKLVDTTQGLPFAVNSLVENVGINNIWETFEISLPYVGVVVLVSFGFYLIFHNIKELSKGREKMN